MALPDFLSAVRVLIMDLGDLPETEPERRSEYGRLFPGLSSAELDDLAAIPPQKLRTYTSTIFYGERAMLKNHFACSTTILERHWPAVYGEEFELHKIIRDLHRTHPWKSYRTRVFAGNFVDYIREDLPELVEKASVLPEFASLELLALDIKRAPMDQWSAKDSPSRSEIASLQVEELLESQFLVPASAGFLECSFDVSSAYRQFYTSDDRSLPANIPEQPTYILGGRNKELFSRFENIPEAVFRFFTTIPRQDPVSIEALASVYLYDAPQDQPQEQLFLLFLQQLLALADIGGLVLLPHDADIRPAAQS